MAEAAGKTVSRISSSVRNRSGVGPSGHEFAVQQSVMAFKCAAYELKFSSTVLPAFAQQSNGTVVASVAKRVCTAHVSPHVVRNQERQSCRNADQESHWHWRFESHSQGKKTSVLRTLTCISIDFLAYHNPRIST